eukprot:CFRG7153T1
MRRNSRSVPDLSVLKKSSLKELPAPLDGELPDELLQLSYHKHLENSKSAVIETDNSSTKTTAITYTRSESLPAGSRAVEDAKKSPGSTDKPTERRRMHVMLEKRRRASMKERFDELIKTVPLCNTRTRKVAILSKTVNYIKHLRQELETINTDNFRLADTLRVRGVSPRAQATHVHAHPHTPAHHTNSSPDPNMFNMSAARGGSGAVANNSGLSFDFVGDGRMGLGVGVGGRSGAASPNLNFDAMGPTVGSVGSVSMFGGMGMSMGGQPPMKLEPRIAAAAFNSPMHSNSQSPLSMKTSLDNKRFKGLRGGLGGTSLLHSVSVPDLQSLTNHYAQMRTPQHTQNSNSQQQQFMAFPGLSSTPPTASNMQGQQQFAPPSAAYTHPHTHAGGGLAHADPVSSIRRGGDNEGAGHVSQQVQRGYAFSTDSLFPNSAHTFNLGM